jgi:signal transduction histidine kinase
VLPRPLDPVRSIKLKLGILLVASGAAGLTVFWYGIGWIAYRTAGAAILVALATSQILAHGMTAPLREMTAAARAMARGDYRQRVRATSRDEVGELAAAFNSMAAELAAADRQRRELIANVSHELRTPITAVRAVLENAVDGVAPADPATLRTALAQTERLGALVTELLDLSRIDAGVAPLNREQFDVAELLAQVVAEAEVAAAATGRTLRFAVAPPAEIRGYADPQRLAQVLANLLDNARRYTPDGGEITVTVDHAPARAVPADALQADVVQADDVRADAEQADAEQADAVQVLDVPVGNGRAADAGPVGRGSGEPLARVRVADSGPGVPAEDRERIFDRLVRLDDARSHDPGEGGRGGAGLGLAIARGIARAHGGELRCDRDSVFELILPTSGTPVGGTATSGAAVGDTAAELPLPTTDHSADPGQLPVSSG